MDRSGQISIDYVAGALVFFGALIVLVSSVINAVPQIEDAQQLNDLELTGWAASEVLLKDEGYWQNATASGTDWHTHVSDATVLGLSTGERRHISRDKLQALRNMDYQAMRNTMGTDVEFSIEFTEIIHVDTYQRYRRSDPPSHITEPSYPLGTQTRIHYGSRTINGTPYYVLLANTAGWYNMLWISDDWDFTDGETDRYNLTQDGSVTLDGDTYLVDIGSSQVSDGKLLLLKRSLGRTGTVPGDGVTDIVEIERYGVLDGNIVQLVMQLWH